MKGSRNRVVPCRLGSTYCNIQLISQQVTTNTLSAQSKLADVA